MTSCPQCGVEWNPATVVCTTCSYVDARDPQPEPVAAVVDGRFTRPIGLGIPTQRSAAFNVLHASTAPAPNPYLAAERRQQSTYRTVATTS